MNTLAGLSLVFTCDIQNGINMSAVQERKQAEQLFYQFYI